MAISKFRFTKILLMIWLIFATLYVLYGEYNHFRNIVSKRFYERGKLDQAISILRKAEECKPKGLDRERSKNTHKAE